MPFSGWNFSPCFFNKRDTSSNGASVYFSIVMMSCLVYWRCINDLIKSVQSVHPIKNPIIDNISASGSTNPWRGEPKNNTTKKIPRKNHLSNEKHIGPKRNVVFSGRKDCRGWFLIPKLWGWYGVLVVINHGNFGSQIKQPRIRWKVFRGILLNVAKNRRLRSSSQLATVWRNIRNKHSQVYIKHWIPANCSLRGSWWMTLNKHRL